MPRKLNLTTIIMAGGSGTRLWPSSRKNYPKQFLSLAGSESFIQMTARRLAPLSGPDGVFVVTDGAYTFNVINQLSPVLGGNFDRVIVEPAGR
ncbi:MAG TPA: sugar phosphate nucleotidyltransferase, partial [Spirochaetota bacterium]|nr:sugar phosphate nucleotidyltransferase [Spirochaetota bacterium]